MLDKNQLKTILLASLDHEIEAAFAAAQQAQETASHEDNQPENQYDTLSLEAAYLAHGQSERILQLQEERIVLAKWPIPEFSEDDVIALGALVVVENGSDDSGEAEKIIWITPKGGRSIECRGKTILVVSPDAPLAKQLVGLSEGDEIILGQDRPGAQAYWEIVSLV
ncbi:hypothetical protein [Bacterioplanoides sp.]|uniref:hypothetical protein n=1 Tax=Bacterioplanoides sp. TaxID=2066072 RepID=UPI003B5C29A0